MKLEDLVPPLEMCKQIPAGKFDDSALVWKIDQDGCEYVIDREIAEYEGEKWIPAPTLQEIIDKIAEIYVWPGVTTMWFTETQTWFTLWNAAGDDYGNSTNLGDGDSINRSEIALRCLLADHFECPVKKAIDDIADSLRHNTSGMCDDSQVSQTSQTSPQKKKRKTNDRRP